MSREGPRRTINHQPSRRMVDASPGRSSAHASAVAAGGAWAASVGSSEASSSRTWRDPIGAMTRAYHAYRDGCRQLRRRIFGSDFEQIQARAEQWRN